MYQKVLNYCQEHSMIEKNDKIIVGISGGADSVCLLELLCQMRETIPIEIFAVHVNHGIRQEAKRDADFVRKLCDQKEIPFYLRDANIPQIARQQHLSSEEAGRKIRYDAFEEIRKQLQANKIAVAHNKNDQAETVLFHLLRGCGIKGISGIRPVRGNIIRPLLCVERCEIESYLSGKKITYCTDHTNGEDTYTRNRIRNRILPLAEKIVNTNIVSHIAETAEIAAQTDEYLMEQASSIYKIIVKENPAVNEYELDEMGFQKLAPIMKKYLVRICLDKVAGSNKDITAVHIREICGLVNKQVGKKIQLPNNISIIKTYSGLVFSLNKEEKENLIRNKNVEITAGNSIEIENFGKLNTRIFAIEREQIIPQNLYTKWFDYDKIKESLLLRNRRQGDFLVINDKGSRKSLKQYMIEEKIPKELRDEMLILADGSHVLWVPGYRISHYYKIGNHTKNIIEIELTGGK